MGIGKNIKHYREIRGMGLRELARLIPMSAPALSRLEKNDWDPKAPNLFKIAQALGVSVDVLSGNEMPSTNVNVFFPGNWDNLTEAEKDLIKATIRVIEERKGT